MIILMRKCRVASVKSACTRMGKSSYTNLQEHNEAHRPAHFFSARVLYTIFYLFYMLMRIDDTKSPLTISGASRSVVRLCGTYTHPTCIASMSSSAATA